MQSGNAGRYQAEKSVEDGGMTQHMTTEWDYDKKDYRRVPDPAIERYVSICNGSYLFDFKYMPYRLLVHAKWPMMTDNGMVVEMGKIVIEEEDFERVIEVLQERIAVRDAKTIDTTT